MRDLAGKDMLTLWTLEAKCAMLIARRASNARAPYGFAHLSWAMCIMAKRLPRRACGLGAAVLVTGTRDAGSLDWSIPVGSRSLMPA